MRIIIRWGPLSPRLRIRLTFDPENFDRFCTHGCSFPPISEIRPSLLQKPQLPCTARSLACGYAAPQAIFWSIAAGIAKITQQLRRNQSLSSNFRRIFLTPYVTQTVLCKGDTRIYTHKYPYPFFTVGLKKAYVDLEYISERSVEIFMKNRYML